MNAKKTLHIVAREADRRRSIVKAALDVTLNSDQREAARELFESAYLDRVKFEIFQYADHVGVLLALDDETVQQLRRQLAKTLIR